METALFCDRYQSLVMSLVIRVKKIGGIMSDKTKNIIWKFIEFILACLAGGGTAYMMG